MDFYTNFQVIKGRVHVRGYRNGNRYVEKIPYKPKLYVRPGNEVETTHTTIHGEPVATISFDSISEAKDFLFTYKDVENYPIYGQNKFELACIAERYPGEDLEWDIAQLKIYHLDIEVASANGFPEPSEAQEEVLLITIVDNTTQKTITFGTRPYNGKSDTDYRLFANEKEMLKAFVDFWSSFYPDIVTGWNVLLFDILYLVNRIKRTLGDSYANRMAPYGYKEREFEKFGKTQQEINLQGVAVLDYYDLYRKFTYSDQESWTLNHIAYVELKERKVDHSEYENFEQFYTNDWDKFVDYNIHDTRLVYRLEKKLRMIELCCIMAYDARINYEDVFSQVRFWDSTICNYLMKKNIVTPPQTFTGKKEKFKGAHVMTPKQGFYKWVVNFDATSLYPSWILQNNMSPETIMPPETDMVVDVPGMVAKTYDLSDLKTHNVNMAANGVHFRNDHYGYFPEIVKKFFDSRQFFKGKMKDAEKKYKETGDEFWKQEAAKFNVYQMARKISINSLYGVAGSPYFRYFSVRYAEAITKSGQTIIHLVGETVNKYFNTLLKTEGVEYAFYGDTDSIYLTLDALVQKVIPDETDKRKIVKFLDKVCTEKISPLLQKTCDDYAEYTNAYKSHIEFKREKIADSGLWTGVKKRYAVNVYNSEGKDLDPPELQITGIEVVRSSTPEFVRDKLKEGIALIMSGTEDDMHKFIAEAKADFIKQAPDVVAFPRGVSELAKYADPNNIYGSGTPIAVRGALLYNDKLRKLKLSKKYAEIKEGEKIKFIYLKEPNPLHENIISFMGKLPKEFELHDYVDYDTQFDKTFVEPLKSLLECVKWNTEPTSSIDDLFS